MHRVGVLVRAVAVGVLLSGLLLGAGQILGAGAATTLTVGPNVDITKAQGSEAEGAIGVNPANSNLLFMASNAETTFGLQAATSSDGGATWTNRNLSNLPAACCDPTVSWDHFGNLFLAYVNSATNAIDVALSTDNGATFKSIATMGTGGKPDQPTITTGANTVWVNFEEGAQFASGAAVTGLGHVGTFATETVTGQDDGQFGDIAVGPGGEVIVTNETGPGSTDKAGTATPAAVQQGGQIVVSVDPDGLGPKPFGPAVLVSNTNVGKFYSIPAQPDRSIDAEPGLAVDTTGGPNNGRIYLVYTDATTNGGADTNIFLRTSTDNGATWSPRLKVNDDGTTKSQFLPHLALDPTNGNIAVTFYDSRRDRGVVGQGSTNTIPNDNAEVFGTVSTNGGTSFLPNVKISAGTSYGHGEPANNFGDWRKSVFQGNQLWVTWADNSNSTGNNPDGALTNMDVLISKVVVSATTTTTTTTRPPATTTTTRPPATTTTTRPPATTTTTRPGATTTTTCASGSGGTGGTGGGGTGGCGV